MNRTYLLAFAILILNHPASGQSRFGLKAGINLADQVKKISIPSMPSITQHTKPFVGYQLGAFYKADLHNHFSLSAEANFSVIGSGMTLMTADGKSYHTHDKLGYIEIPLTIQYSIGKIYFGAGPGVGFKVFSKMTNFGSRSYDIPGYRTIDAAGNFLAGCIISKKLDVNVRYSHGLVNLYSDPGYATTSNRFFNLSFLYSLK